MKKGDKTKEQLKDESVKLSRRIIELEQLINKFQRNEKKIKESEELYKTIVDAAPDGIVTTDLKGVITYMNSAMTERTGYSKKDFIGKPFLKIPTIRAKDIPKYVKVMNSLLRGKTPEPSAFEWVHKDGTIYWGKVYISRMKKKGKTVGFQAITRDITEQKKAEEALKKSEEKYRTIVETAPDVIITIDKDGIISSCNKAITKITGFPLEDVLGKHFSKLPFLIPSEIQEFFKILPSLQGRKVPVLQEIQWIHKDGKLHWAEIHLSSLERDNKIFAVQVIGRDITSYKQAEEEKERLYAQLVKSEKMAGIGTLTSGIAHEFNNLVQIMMGHAEFAQRTKKAEDLEEALDIVVKTSDKVTRIIRDLLAFSKVEAPDMKPHSVAETLESVFSLIEGQLEKRNIKILRKYHKTPPVKLNKEELQQVFLNMVTNARDAMHPNGGTLKVMVRHTRKSVKISFKDYGRGIAEKNINRIFEPFYTTKGAFGGDSGLTGTGLGLAVSYGIVKRHGGTITVVSEVDKGTVFTIVLPVG